MRRRAIAATISLALAGCAPWRHDARTWAPEQAAIAAELSTRTRPLADQRGRLDVEALWAMTNSANIIGIGEATHGTREIREVMLALVRRAAQTDAPLAVALELSFNEGLRLDAWARGTWYPPDPQLHTRTFAEVMAPHAPGVGATVESQELFTWIREHNAHAPPARAIRVHGIDVCLHPTCRDDLVAYFADVDPAAQARALLEPLQHRMHELRADPELAAAARTNLATLRARLLASRDAHITKRGVEAHTTALRLIWSSERRVALALLDDAISSSERDTVMADTVTWISEQMEPAARIVVLAHNEHLGRARSTLLSGQESATRPMGEVLAQRFAAAFVIVHTTFDRGNFMAQKIRRPTPVLTSFPIGPAPAGTLEATLRSGDVPYALDVRSAAIGDGALARYVKARQWLRSHGYAWRRIYSAVPLAWTKVAPAQEFDVLVYFPNTSATTPLAYSD